LNCENIWKIWKKSKLNSGDIENMDENSVKIGKIRKKSKLNSEKIWKIWKIIVKK
jgi:hypothetical protein